MKASGLHLAASFAACEAEELRATGMVQAGFDLVARAADGALWHTDGLTNPAQLFERLQRAVPDAEGNTVETQQDGVWLHHRSDGANIFERPERRGPLDDATLLKGFEDAAGHCETAAEYGSLVCGRLARALGAERVMIYRFHPDWTGEVIAERIEDGLDPFLGLRYPATDIPRQARELFLKCGVRHIFSTRTAVADLLGDRPDACPLDLSLTACRSVSPYHLEYLQNMGSGGTATVALIHQGDLWGLVSIHFSAPRMPDLAEILLLRDAFPKINAGLHCVLASEAECRAVRLRRLLRGFEAELDRSADPLAALIFGHASLHRLMNAQGCSIIVGDMVFGVGIFPSPPVVEGLLDIARRLDPMEARFFDRLPEGVSAGGRNGVAGCAIVRLSHEQDATVICYREEVCQTITWGGDPRHTREPDSPGRFTPRKSFDQWVEEVAGCSVPWSRDAREMLDKVLAGALSFLEVAPTEFAILLRNAMRQSLRRDIVHSAALNLVDGIQSAIGLGVETRDTGSRVLALNAPAAEAFAVAPAEAGALSLDDLERIVGTNLSAATERQFSTTLHTLSQGPRDCEVSLSVVLECRRRSSNAADYRVTVFEFRDVTEARRIEAALIAARDRAANDARLRAAYFTKLNHELRTPLNALVGFSELLLLRGGDGLDPQAMQQVRHMNEAATHMATLVRDTLDNAAAVHHVETDRFSSLNLNSVTDEAVRMLRRDAAAREVEIQQDIDDGIQVRSDRRGLFQILLNLLKNGIVYNVSGGRVRIWARDLTADILQVTIEDTGQGMSAEELAMVAKEYRRFSSEPGTGLGLTIVNQLISLLGGTITLSSRPGVGTTVRLTLPKPVAGVERKAG